MQTVSTIVHGCVCATDTYISALALMMETHACVSLARHVLQDCVPVQAVRCQIPVRAHGPSMKFESLHTHQQALRRVPPMWLLQLVRRPPSRAA